MTLVLSSFTLSNHIIKKTTCEGNVSPTIPHPISTIAYGYVSKFPFPRMVQRPFLNRIPFWTTILEKSQRHLFGAPLINFVENTHLIHTHMCT